MRIHLDDRHTEGTGGLQLLWGNKAVIHLFPPHGPIQSLVHPSAGAGIHDCGSGGIERESYDHEDFFNPIHPFLPRLAPILRLEDS